MKKDLFVYFVTAAMLCTALSSCTGKPAETGASEQQTAAAAPAPPAQTQPVSQAVTEPAGSEKPEIRADRPDFTFLRENFPRIDGSTACVPLGQAVASVLLGQPVDTVKSLISFNRTTQSFRNLMNESCDILISGEPNAAVFKEMDDSGFKYELEEIATDALIFVVNESNPVDGLTTDQIRDIYSGKITNWKEVGGNDAQIVPFQRNEGAGSQALIKKLVMKDTPMTEAPEAYVASEMGELMRVVREYDNTANALGYSVYYYANDMKMAKGLKIISVDGVMPSDESIRSRRYPHLNAYYSVISAGAAPDSPQRILYDWLMTDDGQYLIGSMGYVPARKAAEPVLAGGRPAELSVTSGGIKVAADFSMYRDTGLRTDKYTVISGSLDRFVPSDDYGHIYPYTGRILYSGSEEGYSYEAGCEMGLIDDSGRILTDPLWTDISVLTYSDESTGYRDVQLPLYRLARNQVSAEDPDTIESYYRIAAVDGSFITGNEYQHIVTSADRFTVYPTWHNESFEVFDLSGKKLFDSSILEKNNPELAAKKNEWGYGDLWFSDGMYLFETNDGYYYIDENGITVMGPFEYARPFIHGRAAVRYRSGGSTVIDTTGRAVLPAGYEYCGFLRNGGMYGKMPGGGFDVFDVSGSRLLSIEADNLDSLPEGFVAYTYGYGGKESGAAYYDFDGNLLFDDTMFDFTFFSNSMIICCSGKPEFEGNTLIMPDEDEKQGMFLYDLLSGNSLYIEKAESCYPMYVFEGISDLPYMQASYWEDENDSGEWIIDNKDLTVVKEGSFYASPVKDEISGEWYLAMHEQNGYSLTLTDDRLNELGDFSGRLSIRNGLIEVRDEWTDTYYNRDGSILFRYTLSGSLGD